MRKLEVLLLSDGRPGHYHLAEGVVAALGRLAELHVRRLEIRPVKWVPHRFLARLLESRSISPTALLRLGYGLSPSAVGRADVVVSAGGDTLLANAAAARLTGAQNIFCGTLRKLGPESFTLIVSSYRRHKGLPRHLVALKPNKMDPDALGRPRQVPHYGPAHPPRLAGLLIGGDSGFFHYTPAEWDRLLGFAGELSRAWGTRWLLSTSRRTSPHAAEAAARLARDRSVVEEFIDYRSAGPGTLPQIFGKVEVVLCTEDSSTMISEAVSLRLPVIGVSPARHAFKPEEAEYRQLMLEEGWCRFLPIGELDVARFGAALESIRPLQEHHLDRLARQLEERLPGLMAKARA